MNPGFAGSWVQSYDKCFIKKLEATPYKKYIHQDVNIAKTYSVSLNKKLCGYDYDGDELYIGDKVRIGAINDQFVVGTIVGCVNGNIQVEFTNIYESDGYDDPYYIDDVADILAEQGIAEYFVEAAVLQAAH